MFHCDENAPYNLGERSIQCGRRADALKVWMSWKAIGTKGFSDKLEHLFDCKDYCVTKIDRASQLQMLAPAVYLNVLFRYQPNADLTEQALRALNIEIAAILKKQGTYIDYAQYKGQTGIRLILANGQCQQEDIDKMLQKCIDIGDGIYKSYL